MSSAEIAEITYRWSPQAFLKAWEAGVFEGRVELVDGEVIPVSISDWHGELRGCERKRVRAPGGPAPLALH